MSRLQKKCFFASAATHGLLLALLFISPAFLPKKEKFEDLRLLTMIPSQLIDDPFVGGGASNPAPPPTEKAQPAPDIRPVTPPTLPPPEPLPETKPEPAKPAPKVEPEPEPEPIIPPKTEKPVERIPTPKKKESKPTPETTENTPKKKPTGKVVPSFETAPEDSSKHAEAEAAAARARAAAQAQRSRVTQIARALDKGLSHGTEIGIPGPGSGAYMNYDLAIKLIFDRAWDPGDLAENDSTVTALVTILRDGTVSSYNVVRRSGIAALDRSVDRALQSVKHVPPFPEGAKDDRREFRINFNLKSKRQSE